MANNVCRVLKVLPERRLVVKCLEVKTFRERLSEPREWRRAMLDYNSIEAASAQLFVEVFRVNGVGQVWKAR